MSTERDIAPDHIKERSTNKKTPDYVTRASQPRGGGGVDMYTCTPPASDVHPFEGDPEAIGAIAERVLDDLAARRREALSRLARSHRPTDRKDQP